MKPGPPLSPLHAPMPPISDPMHMMADVKVSGINVAAFSRHFLISSGLGFGLFVVCRRFLHEQAHR